MNNKGLFSGVLSWQTMMPRWGHDAVARVFLRHGAQLWFLRTNIVGGNDPRVEPVPPTTLFGNIPVLGRVVQRFADAFATPVTWAGVLFTLVALALYGALAIPFGLKSRFLVQQSAVDNPVRFVLHTLRLLFVPALLEEIVFRVMLLPHPVEGIAVWRWLLWAIASLVLFVLYHRALGKTTYRAANDTLSDRRFLILTAGLGLFLTGLYWLTGSLWLCTFFHWVVVVVWIYALGGKARLPHTLRRRKKRPKEPTLEHIEAEG